MHIFSLHRVWAISYNCLALYNGCYTYVSKFHRGQAALWEIISTLLLWFKCGLSQHKTCWDWIGVVHPLRDASVFKMNYIPQEHVVPVGSPFGLFYSLGMQCYPPRDDSAMEPLSYACGTLLGSASHQNCEPNNHFSLHSIRWYARSTEPTETTF